uniref:Uncharacterized protein n=1 Tax=Arion vulgaris TaxID=1028688 RepID=A0A0B7AIX5_9EUPU
MKCLQCQWFKFKIRSEEDQNGDHNPDFKHVKKGKCSSLFDISGCKLFLWMGNFKN